MVAPTSSRGLLAICGLALLGALTACAGGERSRPLAQTGAADTPTPAVSAAADVERAAAPTTAAAPAPTDDTLRDALQAVGPDVREYFSHVVSLTNAFFEGRAADTRGDELAADYLEFHFRRMGLQPAFGTDTSENGFQQTFTVRGGLDVGVASAGFAGRNSGASFEKGVEFNPLGFSGNGTVTAPLSFVGYAIESGPDDFSSFGEDDDLTGTIALMLRFEPVGSDGQSAWGGDGGWTRQAALAGKVQAAVARGAEGIILVNPPGITDPRAEYIETHESTNFRMGVDVPVIMLSQDAADALIRASCVQFGSAMGAREMADTGGGTVAMEDDEVMVTMTVELERERIPTSNVAAILPGQGALADEFVIIGGHYDHLGYGYFGSREPSARGEVHVGADDNASGTAGILLSAKWLAERYDALPEKASARSVLFLAFAGEEMGLLGAQHFAETTDLEASDISGMLNMDMIGRLRRDRLSVSGVGTSGSWGVILDEAASANDLRLQKSNSGVGASDHTIFYRAGIPALHFFSGLHDDYHTSRDTFDTLNYEGAVRVTRMVADVAFELATRSEQLAFRSTGDPGRGQARGGASVRLGIMPSNYDDDDASGVPIGEVFAGTSAAEAGIEGGDRLIRWGDSDLADIAELMEQLRSHKPGDVVQVVVLRDGEEVPLEVTLKAPDTGR
jgi:Zn-dependent M28 family amino/carboxypeptidase